MTPPQRTPASYALVPELFGQRNLNGWVPVSSREEVAASKAARLHHHVAVAVREFLSARGLQQQHLKDELGAGWGPGKVSRLLSGAATMSTPQMYTLLDLCGLTLTALVGELAGDELPAPVRRRIITDYLQERLLTVQEETVDSASAHP